MSKKKTALVAALVIVGIAALGLGVAVYAKYISTIQKTGRTTVAKWNFTNVNTAGSVTCEMAESYTAATLAADRIAPGTRGKCPIEVSNVGTEVGIRYDITVSADANQPTHLKFYTDDSYNTELTGNTTSTGTLLPNAAATTVYVYWEWPFEDDPSTSAYDAIDTGEGQTAATMTMTFDVTGTQLQPATN